MASQDLFGTLALGIWKLFIICDLLFGAWNFLYSKAQL
jgi:hypothetical protein